MRCSPGSIPTSRKQSGHGSTSVNCPRASACAARTAQLLNLSDLARDVDVSVPTAKSWLPVLVASCQVFLLQPYHASVTKRLLKTLKLYFLDTGLCAYLTGWASPATLAAGAMRGAHLRDARGGRGAQELVAPGAQPADLLLPRSRRSRDRSGVRCRRQALAGGDQARGHGAPRMGRPVHRARAPQEARHSRCGSVPHVRAAPCNPGRHRTAHRGVV